jgi:AcrR family transcriptional regulator
LSVPAGPSARERAARQRQRILNAAESCFIASGFHAASMAQIAATADISAGLIYRYFESKSAIVKAIIDRHLESESLRVIDRLNATDDMVDELLNVFERYRSRTDPKMNAALLLELTAESTRDPKLMQVVRSKDHVIGASLRQAVRRSAAAQGVRLTAVEARTRAVMLQCLVEGLAMRSIRDPALQRKDLRASIKLIVAALLS